MAEALAGKPSNQPKKGLSKPKPRKFLEIGSCKREVGTRTCRDVFQTDCRGRRRDKRFDPANGRKADARIRTADPFITSYARLHPGFGYFRRRLGSEEVGFSAQLRRTPPRSRDVFQRCSNRPTSVAGSAGRSQLPSKKPSKLLALETRVLEDAVQGSLLQLPVQRYDEERRTVGVPETDVASALPSDLPTEPFEYTNELRARDDRQALAHAGSGNLRRRMPAPISRPSSRRPST